MVIIERNQSKNQLSVLEKEITSLQNLVSKREKWLADPINKRRGTFKAVKDDTNQIRQTLQESKMEYQELLNKALKDGQSN